MASPCNNSPDEVIEKIISAKANADKFDKFINGTDTQTVQLGSGSPTPSIRNVVRQVKADGEWIKQFIADAPEGDVSLNNVTALGSISSRTLTERFSDIVNVRDFGAKGDGVNDDTDEIQAALTASSGRGVVFPAGDYRVSAMLSIPENTSIFAAGNAVLTNTNSQLENLFEITEQNVSIDGLSFVNMQKGSSTEEETYDNSAVLIGKGGDFCSVTNCYFDNFVAGIRSTTNNDGLIKDIYISGCRFNRYDFGIIPDDFDGCTICGCYGRNVERTRYDPDQGLKPSHLLYVTDRSGTASRALSVVNCIESGNAYSSSFKVRNVEGVTITGCVSDLSCRGYEIGSCTDVSVTGNVFSNAVVCEGDSFQPAYWFTSVTRGVLSGNTASYPSGVAGVCFRITGDSDCILVTGNNISVSYSNSMYRYIFHIAPAKHITIQGNTIVNTSGEYFSIEIMHLTEVEDCVIFGNMYQDINQSNNPTLVEATGCVRVYVRLESLLFSPTRHLSNTFSNCTDCYAFDEGTIPPSYYSSIPPLRFFDDNLSGLRGFGDGVALISNNSRIASFNDSVTHLYGSGCIAYCSVWPNDTATHDLGLSNKKWANVWVSSGVINDSDQRVKTEIGSIPDEVLDAWGDVDFVQFKRTEAVAEKGSAARLHSGIVAQDIKAVFEANGLDPAAYGFFCHDEWDAVEEERDENGEVTRDAVEAGDRYSLRYEEALCLEAAYQRRLGEKRDARIAELEARLNEISGNRPAPSGASPNNL